MKQSSYFISILIFFMSSCYYTEEADILIHNARIYTVDANFTISEAMAIKDGKIIDIGPNNELKNRYNPKQEIDAKMRPIYPGFIDAHCHFLWYGNSFFEVDLNETKSWEEVIKRTSEFAGKNDDLWIKGRGWDQNDWVSKEFPNKAKLDSLFPDRAVFLRRIDEHAAIINQKAIELAGIDESTEIDGGVFEKKNGQLTGLILDNAIGLIQKAIPVLNTKQMNRALLKAQEMCFEKGLTTVDDAMLDNNMVHAIDDLQKSGKLKMKVYGMLVPSIENKKEFLQSGPYLTDQLSIRSFKYFADGALGSRGAKLIEPYSDDIHNTGLFLKDSNYLANEASELMKHGFQMNTHCIGDAANRLMLDIYGNELKTTNDKRWRIEHCQIVKKEDLEKFRKFTIIPSIQPTHATSDMYWVEERLGSERIKTAYAYQDLLQLNGILALGTDFPIEDIDPLKTFYAAISRKDSKNYPEGGFQKENALSRKEALKGMTIWAAMANFEENKKGSLEVGKVADFIIFNKDIMQITEENILESMVISTFIDGKEVYTKD